MRLGSLTSTLRLITFSSIWNSRLKSSISDVLFPSNPREQLFASPFPPFTGLPKYTKGFMIKNKWIFSLWASSCLWLLLGSSLLIQQGRRTPIMKPSALRRRTPVSGHTIKSRHRSVKSLLTSSTKCFILTLKKDCR